ncbi:hypothetical protein HK103_006281 [Boothiomyces macroporosus]|uniref:Uncharacterized protein n=1 Tax=Boothiomyces macroporosus TaxID=261099 RepID=A0AAD5Y4R5_9FUNG|nr:hypothetical protein HK103_006281 [Boothiomyces macroporosus]
MISSAYHRYNHLHTRQSTNLFNQDIAYDRIGELLLVLTLLTDLITTAATTSRQSRFKAVGLFAAYSTYYLFVFIAHCNNVPTNVSNALCLVASFFWGFGGAAIAYYEFTQFTAIVKSLRPAHTYIAEGARVVITIALVIDGIFLNLDYLSPYIPLPPMFGSLVLVNLIQSAVCIPRMFSTIWMLYVVKDISKISDGLVRTLGMNYLGISGFQMMDGLVGLVIMFSDLGFDSRFVSLAGCIELIMLHYAICKMLASDLLPAKPPDNFESNRQSAIPATIKNSVN